MSLSSQLKSLLFYLLYECFRSFYFSPPPMADKLKKFLVFLRKIYDPIYCTLVHLHLKFQISAGMLITLYFLGGFSSFCLRSRHECKPEACSFLLATWLHNPYSQKLSIDLEEKQHNEGDCS